MAETREPRRGADEPLPRSVIWAVAVGQGGMSILINLVGLTLVYFYLPPAEASLPQLVTDTTYLLIINAIVLIAAAGRILDAVTDPLIALWSDRTDTRRGRRIPFMAWGALPAAIATFAMFTPPVDSVSGWNIVWLLGVQAVLFIALTAYVTPCFSLTADLGATQEERLSITVWASVSWAIGIVIAATAPFLATMFEADGLETVQSWQAAIAIICTIAAVFMYVPVFRVDERRWVAAPAETVPVRTVIRTVVDNPYFRYYAAADFSYFAGLTILTTGLLYYVTVLLELSQGFVAPLLLLMVLLSLALYPVVNAQARRRSAKTMVITAFFIVAFDFLLVIWLGKLPMPSEAEAVLVVVIFSVAFAILSVLPQWILSDIATESMATTGNSTNAAFFAARTFLQKFGQTVGVVLFALLTSFGRDVGNDLGIRLSGVGGAVLFLVAALLFRNYDEAGLRRHLAAASDDERVSQA